MRTYHENHRSTTSSPPRCIIAGRYQREFLAAKRSFLEAARNRAAISDLRHKQGLLLRAIAAKRNHICAICSPEALD